MGPDVEKSLNKLPKMGAQELYERMVKATGINEADYVNTMRTYENGILDMRAFIKKVDPFLRNLKVDLSRSLSTKQRVM